MILKEVYIYKRLTVYSLFCDIEQIQFKYINEEDKTMTNDNKELDLEMLDKIAGGNDQQVNEYLREIAAKKGLNLDEVGRMVVLNRMTREEEYELLRRIEAR